MKTLHVIAALLHYPGHELQQAATELQAVLETQPLLSPAEVAALSRFVGALAEQDLMEAQARYVDTFDRGRATSLHLFEHVHGESRDRGQAMVDLLGVYQRHGFEIAVSELPDYIPLFLEFCSTLPEAEARDWLGEVGHILQLLHVRLCERESPYAVLFPPLLALAQMEPAPEAVVRQVNGESRDDTPEALDRAWAEVPVTFGPDADGACPGSAPRRPEAQPVVWGNAPHTHP